MLLNIGDAANLPLGRSVMAFGRTAARVIMTLSLAAVAPAYASKELAIKAICMGCHQVDRKVVGPAFREVGARYGVADEARLVEKVMKGGGGVWGLVPMPPQAALKPEDARTLVRWILSGAN
jgi:cytochrome c